MKNYIHTYLVLGTVANSANYQALEQRPDFINVSSSAWYLRVTACNAAGCSAYSNQVNAYYFNGCL
ncbi:hypothetical protein MNBD_GAMMA03-284 [hydrothermal vent metagenome]|uniref:Uncharacterized protein n=1 Tax=hydrothermal vent metagenome TaxID=652676 RepID=A0A3B0W936_9ZZZZ